MVVALTPGSAAIAERHSIRGASCPGADLRMTPDTRVAVERAVVCLVNSFRQDRNLQPLRKASELHSSARDFVQSMMVKHFFGHIDPDGDTLEMRVRAHLYVKPSKRDWLVAENISVMRGPLATALHVVRNWMASPGHRANMLRAALREIGAGAAAGSPDDSSEDAITVVLDLGSRKP